MRGNSKVQKMADKLFIYLPINLVELENIKQGNIVDYEIFNPYPDKILEPKQGKNFHKKAVEDIPPIEVVKNESSNEMQPM